MPLVLEEIAPSAPAEFLVDAAVCLAASLKAEMCSAKSETTVMQDDIQMPGIFHTHLTSLAAPLKPATQQRERWKVSLLLQLLPHGRLMAAVQPRNDTVPPEIKPHSGEASGFCTQW